MPRYISSFDVLPATAACRCNITAQAHKDRRVDRGRWTNDEAAIRSFFFNVVKSGVHDEVILQLVSRAKGPNV